MPHPSHASPPRPPRTSELESEAAGSGPASAAASATPAAGSGEGEAPDAAPPLFVRHPRNPSGRDFVAGDIHGMFPHLRALLERLRFEPERDRLFSVGDLVDRGPDSPATLDWLAQPWFHAVRGNHEQFVLEADDPESLEVWLRYNGGEWWAEVSEAEREAFRRALGALPLAMEVDTDHGVVGIVHADVPPLVTWDRFVELLCAADRDATFYAMWSRNRVQGLQSTATVQGRVSRVYCGHTPIRCVTSFGNVHFIDTGAVYALEGYEEASLTLVEIQPAEHELHSIRTSEPVPGDPSPPAGRVAAPGA